MPRLDLAVALGVGVGGALVDVSSYARLTDGLARKWGRTDAFYGVEPGTFSFVLDNADGRFTPENAGSPLDTTLSEGMAACVQVGSRLTAGTVRSIEPEFPSGDAAWSRVRVTCDDALGPPARLTFSDVTRGAAFGVGCGGFWAFDDAVGSTVFAGATGRERSLYVTGAVSATLEVAPTVLGNPQQVTLTNQSAGTSGGAEPITTFGVTQDYADGAFVGVWVTPRALSGTLGFFAILDDGSVRSQVEFGIDSGGFFIFETAIPGNVVVGTATVGTPYYLAVSNNNEMWINGVLVYSGSPLFSGSENLIGIQVDNTASASISSLSITDSRVLADAMANSLDSVMHGLVAQPAGIDVAAAGSEFRGTILSAGEFTGSGLDFINLFLESEQGHVYVTTSGTLTSPTPQLNLTGRIRPESITCSFDVENELSGAPAFVRDITNLVSRVDVDGPTASNTVDDLALVARAGRASDNATIMAVNERDRVAWGQDRLARGANTTMQIQSVVIDAMTTPTDRSTDLLALVPGDRVQFTGLPDTVLGFDTWDGWFLGANETHTLYEHTFELYFQPVLPPTAKYDTAKYMASGELTLTAAINAAVTSISVTSTGALLSTTAVPYVMQLDDEQVTVTAVTGASSPQTVTISRGANGTTAATHVISTVLVGPVPESIYAF